MNLSADEVARRIAEGEGTRLEFKRGLPAPDKLARTLSAFANTKGGLLLVGVDDDGAVPGIAEGAARADQICAELSSIAALRIEPPLRPSVGVVRLDGTRIVTCLVAASNARPHAALLDDGTRDVCIRLGSSTRSAEGASLAALRSGPTPLGACTALQRDVLAWLARQADPGGRGAARATSDAFAAARNIGRSRARRSFVALERAGLIIGHGPGPGRQFALPE